MRKRLNRMRLHIRILIILLLMMPELLAQFDSTIWYNYYSNHSVSSRDNFKKACLINNGTSILINGRTESDFSNFDISTFVVNKNLDTAWRNNYSTSGNDISDNNPSDVSCDSAGNIYIAGFKTKYVSSIIYYLYPVLYKLDSTGKFLWSYLFDDFSGYDLDFEAYSLDIECDDLGNCYLLAEGWQPGLTPAARTFIIKFNQEGDIIWCKKSLLYSAEKLIVDNDQNIFIINNGDEDQNKKTIIQKYNKSGDLISEQRYYNYYVDLIEAKTDKNNSLWTFSNFSYGGLGDTRTCDILISHYDSEGILIGQKIYDSQYHNYESLKEVAFYNDSTFLVGIDSKDPENGLDNLLILVNSNLQVIDSFRFNSEWNDNDYLISFDITGKSIFLTGISFTDSYSSFPYIFRLDNFRQIKWIKIPGISESITTYPKKLLLGSDSCLFLIGDVEMTISPESGYNTHTDVFITEYDTKGTEMLTREYSGTGKSFIVGKTVQLDKQDNIYVSGIEQYGPDYVFPDHLFDQGIVLHKYSENGSLIWNKGIAVSKSQLEFVTHFLSGDSLITIVTGFPGQADGNTVLYNFDRTGSLLDSAKYFKKAVSALTDNSGFFYLFFIAIPPVKATPILYHQLDGSSK